MNQIGLSPGFKAIMSYPNVRSLIGLSPGRTVTTPSHIHRENLEFRSELDKWAQEMNETPRQNTSLFETNPALKRGRPSSPDLERDSVAAQAKRRKNDAEEVGDQPVREEDNYSILDAMLWDPSYPVLTKPTLEPSEKNPDQSLHDSQHHQKPQTLDCLLEGEDVVPGGTLTFAIWEDIDAGYDDYRMVGLQTRTWISESEDEEKENEPVAFDVTMEDALPTPENSAAEVDELDGDQPQFERVVLGEIQL